MKNEKLQVALLIHAAEGEVERGFNALFNTVAGGEADKPGMCVLNDTFESYHIRKKLTQWKTYLPEEKLDEKQKTHE